MIPLGLSSNDLFFSSIVWGAWSVAIISMVLSFKPAIILALSSSLLRGGFIFARVLCFSTSFSLKVK